MLLESSTRRPRVQVLAVDWCSTLPSGSTPHLSLVAWPRGVRVAWLGVDRAACAKANRHENQKTHHGNLRVEV
jgi:hypothetical protein